MITVPITGLRAYSSGAAIDLRDGSGRTRATYSSLRVTDASGRDLRATMRPSSNGKDIAITVHDRGADYPLTIDPTFTQVAELTGSDGAADDYFGAAVAISGSTAFVGAPYHEVDGHTTEGAVYVYTLSDGTWSQSAELTASDGAAYDEFGFSLTLSGDTAIIGSPVHGVGGSVYVFTLSDG
ncbi:MAG: FG-GAP repeat protein, partial [Acidimicrobiales bacterium]